MLRATAVTDTVSKMIASDWAITAIVIGIILFDGVDHRPSIFMALSKVSAFTP